MNKKVIFLWVFFIFFLFAAGIAQAVPSWHKPIPCVGCHGETLNVPAGGGGEGDECGGCHKYRLPAGGINVSKMEEEHNPNICRTCHMGNTLVNASEKELFHNGHNATEDNFTIIKIQSNGFQCVSCHGSKIHGIHIKNLGKACPICHGSWAKDKVYIENNASSSSNTSLENSNLERFTIFAFIKNLFNAIFGVK